MEPTRTAPAECPTVDEISTRGTGLRRGSAGGGPADLRPSHYMRRVISPWTGPHWACVHCGTTRPATPTGDVR